LRLLANILVMWLWYDLAQWVTSLVPLAHQNISMYLFGAFGFLVSLGTYHVFDKIVERKKKV
jgi:predicted membrane channel-forming protein YqfA (hemolysin III family)